MSAIKEAKTKFSQAKVKDILSDYRLAVESREASIIGRKEVFMGKAKFGIFGDGKEVAQIAMAKVFRKGDFRSGYYRDQTFMFAIGELTVQQFFAQLYAHTDLEADPSTAGRLMTGHFGTRTLDENGKFKRLTEQKNSSADISPTAGQMPRLLGLAYASKLYRNNPALKEYADFSINGNEIAFGTIGNASTSEGMFFEAINAAGVLQVPMLTSVWDDAYGISVPAEYHTTKGSISKVLAGLQRTATEKGFEIITAKGWDYQELVEAYQKAEKICREEHVPVLFHVDELTQPQGHSTSGSHERYKSKERLAWEAEHDCIRKMREWIINDVMVLPEDVEAIEKEAKQAAKQARDRAWKAFTEDVRKDQTVISAILDKAETLSKHSEAITHVKNELISTINPTRLETMKAARKAIRFFRDEDHEAKTELIAWLRLAEDDNYNRYSSHLYSASDEAALKVEIIPAQYSDNSSIVDGREVLQACFDAALTRNPLVLAFGEDVGKIGDVNQGFAGLQAKHGELRVTDTGIRECTIIGQGIGAALRGLRPIAEMQYLDYLIYALPTLSDDLACLQYRTKGGQKAPLIVRTRGHRLEGVWHAGSQIGMMLQSLRGIYIITPRNMTQAAGFYNTMLKSDDAAIIVECLNGYRLKERIPDNIGEFNVPLGVPEILKEGSDVTIVTYGSMCRVVMEAAEDLEQFGITCEVIDAQTLLPFDIHHKIVESVKKTNRIIFADEDVPGGATSYMMQKVLEEQDAYQYLDSKPVTITAKEHRPAYASDGDYFTKPSPEDIFETVYALMHEVAPDQYPSLY
ncbi:Pyruvate/2-oxoglutarate/acetoin dehydrogenase complex, dehydrogenase (E1) component [Ohtaekwangia koreensis]|uniref:Pyruvate/2-oxoglutarate/acetoin dehydrogenase complex, dehydrogenase (E1) component n=1 Tax=Ohtaekwangia koreensis TaxID=688867 RepID=A0A1T5K236_9BACT|nr:alpha-ketoacid dehydrogenase subunit alpha/beta [Ohtaekwangia koreensis]SKC57610.1 Pyruvate/2-oxoglutarate/acetoin dehydrogenase complex, dehydrogenase (E1) component [Ohtaekwangia koreensis]